MACLHIVRPGLLTTIQDLGRWGYQNTGVPVAGPMDPLSHRFANRLVDNDEGAATLEVTLIGPEIVCEGEVWFAVSGAEVELHVDDRPAAANLAQRARPGARLRFGRRRRGARAYLAVAGGIDVPPVLGSRATHLLTGLGPFGGRMLAAGDRLPVGSSGSQRPRTRPAAEPVLPLPEGGARLRVIAGRHLHHFPDSTLEALQRHRYVVSSVSDRMGYRLEGPLLPPRPPAEILSEATSLGALQVPPEGQPILLMPDRQTAGGYPKLATVITADMPVAGQLAPGDWIEFALSDRHEAMAALIARERALQRAAPVPGPADVEAGRG